MTKDRLKVAILSMSGQNKSYAQAFYDNPDAEVVAITEDDSPSAETEQDNREWAGKFGVPYVPLLDEVLGRPDVQAFSLCSSFERRVPLVERVAEAGKHILADKPLTTNLADADAIIEIVRRTGIKMMVGHNYRFNPAIIEAREALRKGDVGLPWAIHSEWVASGGLQAAAIGELMNHAMFPLDALLYLVPNKPQTVYAIAGSFFFNNAKANNLEDMSFITMNLDKGVVATTSLGRSPYQNHINGRSGDRTIRVMGTHGMLEIDVNRPNWLSIGKLGAQGLRYGPTPHSEMIAHFVDCILHDRTPMCGPDESLKLKCK
jgi:predicted dehydrogenase